KEFQPFRKRRRRQIVNGFAVVLQGHVQLRRGQCDPRELLDDMGKLGGGCLEKLTANRRVEEKLTDFKLSAIRAATPTRFFHDAAMHFHFSAKLLLTLLGANAEIGYLRNRGECFPTKSH